MNCCCHCPAANLALWMRCLLHLENLWAYGLLSYQLNVWHLLLDMPHTLFKCCVHLFQLERYFQRLKNPKVRVSTFCFQHAQFVWQVTICVKCNGQSHCVICGRISDYTYTQIHQLQIGTSCICVCFKILSYEVHLLVTICSMYQKTRKNVYMVWRY